MQVSSVSSAAAYVPPARPEAAEGAGPDHDGDSDDAVRNTPMPKPAPGRVDVYA